MNSKNIWSSLYDCFDGIKSNICKIVALFFADDGIILMQSLKETIDSIKILSEIADECGLSINKSKSNILIFNSETRHPKFRHYTRLLFCISERQTWRREGRWCAHRCEQ